MLIFFFCEFIAVQKQLKLRWGTAAIENLALDIKQPSCEVAFI